jgi:hypothetical protein
MVALGKLLDKYPELLTEDTKKRIIMIMNMISSQE